MSLNVFIEEDFENEHEAIQAADLCRRLSALIPPDACYTILFNFYLSGKPVDALLVTPHKFIVIDFKYVQTPLRVIDPNRPWMCVDGYELTGSGYGNPFKQVTLYRRQLGHVLLNCRREVFVGGALDMGNAKFDFGRATGLVCGAICLGPQVDAREPAIDECEFPRWFFYGRPKVFVDKCLTLCQGDPVVLNANIHRAFVSCNSGLRRSIVGQDGVPRLPKKDRLLHSVGESVVPSKTPDLVVTEDTTRSGSGVHEQGHRRRNEMHYRVRRSWNR